LPIPKPALASATNCGRAATVFADPAGPGRTGKYDPEKKGPEKTRSQKNFYSWKSGRGQQNGVPHRKIHLEFYPKMLIFNKNFWFITNLGYICITNGSSTKIRFCSFRPLAFGALL
jgi:hypothetical protein